jgi:allene oxide cyclase-like protein
MQLGVPVKKLVLFGAAVVVLAALSAAVASAAGTKSVTMTLVEKDTAFNFVDNPPKGGKNSPPSIGDIFAFTSALLTKSGKRVGHLDATCTVTSRGAHGLSTCTGVFQLPGGQLAAVALVPTDSVQAQDISIVGGTGAYVGASGYLHTISRGANSPYSDDTLHLILPS